LISSVKTAPNEDVEADEFKGLGLKEVVAQHDQSLADLTAETERAKKAAEQAAFAAIENAQDLTALLQTQQLPNDIWQAIGKLIRQLHDLQICHTDLNAHNILVQQLGNEQKCWLIDFDKCGQKSGDSWKQGNLERLHRSFVKEVGRMNIQFNEENWAELLKGYNA